MKVKNDFKILISILVAFLVKSVFSFSFFLTLWVSFINYHLWMSSFQDASKISYLSLILGGEPAFSNSTTPRKHNDVIIKRKYIWSTVDYFSFQ